MQRGKCIAPTAPSSDYGCTLPTCSAKASAGDGSLFE